MDLQLDVTGGPSAPAYARRAVAGLSHVVPAETLEDVQLLVSEVVTNSVVHGGSDFEGVIAVRIHTDPTCVRVEILDDGPGFHPTVTLPEPDRESGWGLAVVDRVAAAWGVEHDRKTRVWFELPLRAS